MKDMAQHKPKLFAILAGLVVGLSAMLLTVGIALAAPVAQEDQPTPTPGLPTGPLGDGACKECHVDIAAAWSESPHAHAYDDPFFQSRWEGVGKEGDCLLCHTTNYQESTHDYDAKGVSCEACHGDVQTDHPPSVVPIRAETEYCGTCHTTTLHEWRLTGHATADVGCTDCHDPHSQDRLFEVSDNLCINCHKDDMEAYLEDLHVQKGIGCVDCHALVIPPDPVPVDGIVPTGHTFTITPATCVACHTDALHSGFSLPGFEDGAAGASQTMDEQANAEAANDELIGVEVPQVAESSLSAQQQIQALQAALANNRMTTLFPGWCDRPSAWVAVPHGSSQITFANRPLCVSWREDEDEEDKSSEGSS